MSTDSARTKANEAIAKIEFNNEDFKDNLHFKCDMIMMYSFRRPYSQMGCQSDAVFRHELNPLEPVGFIRECTVSVLQVGDTRHSSENDYHYLCKSLPLLICDKLTQNWHSPTRAQDMLAQSSRVGAPCCQTAVKWMSSVGGREVTIS